jgi:hypothetical protein
MANETFKLDGKTIDEFKKLKKGKNYAEFVNDMLKTKIIWILQDYQKLKQMKRLPTPEKIFSITMSQPRLVPFSKVETTMLLNCNEKELGWLAQQIYKNPEKAAQNYRHFADEFKNKTTFKNKNNNFYGKYIDENKTFKQMMFLDLLMDFAEARGVSVRFISQYYHLMAPILGSLEKVSFSKMAAILLGFE